MKKIHKIKLFFSRFLWYIEGIHKAVAFHKQIKDYNFLIKTQSVLEMKLLEIKRNEKESESIIRMEAQIGVIKKILRYVSR